MFYKKYSFYLKLILHVGAIDCRETDLITKDIILTDKIYLAN